MSYCPGDRAAAKYSPAELVFTSRAMPVAVFDTATVAPTTTAPCGSRTVPVRDALSWQHATSAKIATKPTSHRTFPFMLHHRRTPFFSSWRRLNQENSGYVGAR